MPPFADYLDRPDVRIDVEAGRVHEHVCLMQDTIGSPDPICLDTLYRSGNQHDVVTIERRIEIV